MFKKKGLCRVLAFCLALCMYLGAADFTVFAAAKAMLTSTIMDGVGGGTWTKTNVPYPAEGSDPNFPSIVIHSKYVDSTGDAEWKVEQTGDDGEKQIWQCYGRDGSTRYYFNQESLHNVNSAGWWLWTNGEKNKTAIVPDVKTLPISNRIGHDFQGVYVATASSFRKDVVSATKPSKAGTACTSGRTLTFHENVDPDTHCGVWWKTSNYTIKVKPNGGSYNNSTSATSISAGYTDEKSIAASTLANWTFSGYKVEYGSGASAHASGGVPTAGNHTAPVKVKKACKGNGTVTLTAQWKATVSFNYNKPSNASGNVTTGDTSKEYTNPTGSTKFGTLPSPTLAGWVFGGWYTEASGGTKIESTTGNKAYGNCTLYAHWTPISYTIAYNKGLTDSTASVPTTATVSYDSNWTTGAKGSLTGRSYTVTYSSNVPASSSTASSVVLSKDKDTGNLPAADPFWSVNATNTPKYSASTTVTKPNFTTTNGDSFTATALWGNATVTLPTISMTGWTFTGWYTAATGGTLQSGNITVVPAATAYSLPLFAQWRNNKYYVRYNGNTSTGGSMPDDTYIWDNTSEEHLSKNTYTKQYTVKFNGIDVNDGIDGGSSEKVCGYIFKHWATAADGTGTVYTDQQSIHNLTPEDEKVIELFAQWEGQGITLPKVTKAGSKFLGWFTVKQGTPTNPSTAVWIGGGPGWDYNTKVVFDKDTELFAWYNEYPVYSNIDSNVFYQHQPISAKQLLWLIDIKDYENDYIKGILSLSASAGMTAVERRELLSAANPDKLKVEITSIDYKRNGKDPHGSYVSDRVMTTQSSDDVKINGLRTGTNPYDTDWLGDIIIHYTVTDDGTYNGTSLIEDSPITLTYDVDGKIIWNYVPVIKTTDRYLFIDDGTNKDNIEDYLLANQEITDVEDNVSNDCWWDASVTTPALLSSVHLEKVYDTTVSPSLEYDDPDAANYLRSIDNIQELFKLKSTQYNIFKYVTGFKVSIDCTDQWGKKASKEYSKEDRSIQVVLINDESDPDVVTAYVKQNIRYVNGKWIDTLGETYWGTYGNDKLNATLDKYEKKGIISKETYSGAYYDGTGRKVTVEVNDYSK